jgi:hypothetical protein
VQVTSNTALHAGRQLGWSRHAWHVLHLEHLAHLAAVTGTQAQAQAPRQAQAAGRPAYQCGDGDGDGYDIPCSQLHHGTGSGRQASYAPVQTASYSGRGGMQSCIISRESGGNPNVTNASGHYGLYQFSYSTWVGSGGSGGDFGHASVAEQNRVFANAVAARGYSDWAAYDGC